MHAIMALDMYFNILKPSETLATEQNDMNQREKEKVIDELRIVKEPKEKDQSTTCRHQLKEPRLPSTLLNKFQLLQHCSMKQNMISNEKSMHCKPGIKSQKIS